MYEQGWRLNNLYWILDEDSNEIKFRMNWAQQELFEGLWFCNLILKARRIGISTLIELILLDNSLFVDNSSAGIIAHNEESAKKLFLRMIKFPYEHLPEAIKNTRKRLVKSAHEYQFSNGSLITVATSLRSGGYQMIHVSEYGKICARFPDRAIEVRTGSLKTVGKGNLKVIESTAEGVDGDFYQKCQQAKAKHDTNKKLNSKDYKFFFFPWWRHPEYRMNPETVKITPEMRKYFAEVQEEIGTSLSAAQRAWYVMELEETGSVELMMREHPSTPDEAFKIALEGSYYVKYINAARRQGRITDVPIETSVPVNTFWDIGNFATIWLHQKVAGEHRFVWYLEIIGEGLPYYIQQLWNLREKYGFVFGTHYLPHDAGHRTLKDTISFSAQGQQLGLTPNVVVDKTSDISAARNLVIMRLSQCWFDQTNCALGISRLEQYRKDWNIRLSCFKDTHREDDNVHGADAFRQWAQGYQGFLYDSDYSNRETYPEPVANY